MYGEAINGEVERYGASCKESGYEGEELEEIMKKHLEKTKADYKRIYDSECKTAIAKAMQAIGEELRSVISEMTGEHKKGTISKTLEEEIKKLMESDYEEHTLKSADAFNSRQTKVSWQKVSPDSHQREIYNKDKRAMKSVIGKLKRKIQLYGNPMTLTIPNQIRGRLNKRQLHRIPSDRSDLFQIRIVQDDKQLDVCLLVDESGSMGHHYMSYARQSCIAVKEALQDNEKLNLWVFGHTADQNDRGATEMYEYASPHMRDRPLACGAMRARYENRDGTAIFTSAERVRSQSEHPSADKLMIVFSDGAPSADGYRGSSAHKHTAKMVKKVEGMGFSVIQVGFGGWATRHQNDMFKHNISVNDINRLPVQIGKILKKVLRI
jgi:nitric oxide reductase activation protein